MTPLEQEMLGKVQAAGEAGYQIPLDPARRAAVERRALESLSRAKRIAPLGDRTYATPEIAAAHWKAEEAEHFADEKAKLNELARKLYLAAHRRDAPEGFDFATAPGARERRMFDAAVLAHTHFRGLPPVYDAATSAAVFPDIDDDTNNDDAQHTGAMP